MPCELSEEQAYLVLNGLPKVGPVSLTRMLEALGGDPRRVLDASAEQLLAVQGVGEGISEAVRQWARHFDLPREQERLRRAGVAFLCRSSVRYPALLRETYDAPVGLYVKGEYDFSRPCVSVIGTRRTTAYGRAFARELGAGLARAGCCVVSGMARGIDTEAHEGALEVGGPTVAVLGTGIDLVYPPENYDLSRRIASLGALVTEFPFTRRADRQSFAMRNRIVAGMSRVTVVVESDEGGGSMITARFAAEQGRTVCAVPGRVDQASSRGCHKLIRDGAALVTSVDEVLEELGMIGQSLLSLEPAPEARVDAAAKTVAQTVAAPPLRTTKAARPSDRQAGLGEAERRVLACFRGGEVLTVDQLVLLLGEEVPEIRAGLMMLELGGHVCCRSDGAYESR